MNKKIEISCEGKDYILEYDRRAVKIMEANGLKINEIESQPFSALQLLWQGAFLKNHKNEPNEKIQEMYDHIQDKSKLNAALISMFMETYNSLIGDNEDQDDSKNIEWKMA